MTTYFPSCYEEVRDIAKELSRETTLLKAFVDDQIEVLSKSVNQLKASTKSSDAVAMNAWMEEYRDLLAVVAVKYLEMYYGIDCKEKFLKETRNVYMSLPPGSYQERWTNRIKYDEKRITPNKDFKYSRVSFCWFEAIFELQPHAKGNKVESMVLSELVSYE